VRRLALTAGLGGALLLGTAAPVAEVHAASGDAAEVIARSSCEEGAGVTTCVRFRATQQKVFTGSGIKHFVVNFSFSLTAADATGTVILRDDEMSHDSILLKDDQTFQEIFEVREAFQINGQTCSRNIKIFVKRGEFEIKQDDITCTW
jgi:hypothetical protein